MVVMDMKDTLYDMALKIDSKINAHEFMTLIDEISNFTEQFYWDSAEHDENFVYVDVEYDAADEKELMDFIKGNDHVQIDHNAMCDWV